MVKHRWITCSEHNVKWWWLQGRCARPTEVVPSVVEKDWFSLGACQRGKLLETKALEKEDGHAERLAERVRSAR